MLCRVWTIGGGIVSAAKIHFEAGSLCWFHTQTTVLQLRPRETIARQVIDRADGLAGWQVLGYGHSRASSWRMGGRRVIVW